jgi:hypothetical protein
LCVKADNISITRVADHDGRLQPPIVKVNGLATNIDISLSHDGRFAAYCFVNEKIFNKNFSKLKHKTC